MDTRLTALVEAAGGAAVKAAGPDDGVCGLAPCAVVEPADAAAVARVLAAASAAGLAVVPRGGGTKLAWGGVPRAADVVLSTRALARVVEHAHDDLTVTVEAGCTLEALAARLAERNQRLALDAAFAARATAGGLLATNDAGALRVRYGTARDLLIGVTLALPDGTLAKSGGKVVKNVAGYDLCKLAIGSFGTLGVITAATFRLFASPRAEETLRFEGDLARLAALVLALGRSTLVPTGVQLVAGRAVRPRLDVRLEGVPQGVAAQKAALAALGASPPAPAPGDAWSAREALLADAGGDAVVVRFGVLPTRLAALLDAAAGPGRRRLARGRAVGGHGRAAFRGRRPGRARARRVGNARRGGVRRRIGHAPRRAPGGARGGRRVGPRGRCAAADAPREAGARSGRRARARPLRRRTVMAAPAFDGRRPPDPAILDECVHCGFCLPTCPTYALWGEEMDSPRGRIYLMRLAHDGSVGMDGPLVRHLDRCLGCMACVPACPSGVRYDRLIEDARAQVERRFRRSAAARLHRRLIFSVFPHPRRLRLALAPVRLAGTLGLRGLLARLAPPAAREALELLPPRLPARAAPLPELIPAVGPRRGRVGLLTGCVQSVLFAGVNAATARVLAAEGFDVVVPRAQGCCGALAAHVGKDGEARAQAAALIAAFDGAGLDAIVVGAAGCGSTMKEYGHLFADDPARRDAAAAFAARVKDLAEFVAAAPPRAPRHPLPLTVAYHDPCHLQHAQGVRAAPRALLAAIPGLTVAEVPESALCCGSAGIYNLVEPGAAKDLGDRKAHNVLATGADLVIASNPGCTLQIAAALRRAGRALPVVHIAELLDASIAGRSPDALRSP